MSETSTIPEIVHLLGCRPFYMAVWMFGEDCCKLLSSFNTSHNALWKVMNNQCDPTKQYIPSSFAFAGKKPNMTYVGKRERGILAKVVNLQLPACVNPEYLEMWNVEIYSFCCVQQHSYMLCKGDKNQEEKRCDHQIQYENWACASNLKWTILLSCAIKTS